MRIGLFSDTYLPQVNGISYVLQITADELTKLGHDVHIFAPATNLQGREPRDTTNVHRFPAVEGIFFSDQLTSLFFPPSVLRKIKLLKLDVIHTFSPGQIGLLGAQAAIREGIPLVSQYSTDLYKYVERYPSVLPGSVILALSSPVILRLKPRELAEAAKLLKPKYSVTAWHKQLIAGMHTLMHERCAAVIALSPKMQKQLQGWNPDSYVALLPTGVDRIVPQSSHAAADFRKKHGIADDDQVLLYVGRLSREKNLDLLIDSFKYIGPKYPKAKLVLVGSYDYEDTLKSRAAGLPDGDRIIFVGAVPRAELGAVYETADVFLFASQTDTQGLVVNEAAASGLPLVLCDADVSEVFIHEKTGLHAPAKARGFANTAMKLLADKSLRQKLGAAAQKEAAKYTEYKQTKKLETIYKRIVG